MRSYEYSLDTGRDPWGFPVEGQDHDELMAACDRLDAQPGSEHQRISEEAHEDYVRLVEGRPVLQ